jgi:hypothetical protein
MGSASMDTSPLVAETAHSTLSSQSKTTWLRTCGAIGAQWYCVPAAAVNVCCSLWQRSSLYTAGPAAITHQDIAAALTAALGCDVVFADVAPGAFAASLRGILPPWQIDGLLEDYAHYRVSQAVTGRPATPSR